MLQLYSSDLRHREKAIRKKPKKRAFFHPRRPRAKSVPGRTQPIKLSTLTVDGTKNSFVTRELSRAFESREIPRLLDVTESRPDQGNSACETCFQLQLNRVHLHECALCKSDSLAFVETQYRGVFSCELNRLNWRRVRIGGFSKMWILVLVLTSNLRFCDLDLILSSSIDQTQKSNFDRSFKKFSII